LFRAKNLNLCYDAAFWLFSAYSEKIWIL